MPGKLGFVLFHEWWMEMGVEEGTSNDEGAECGVEIWRFKSEPVNNGFGFEFFNDSGDGSSGASESFSNIYEAETVEVKFRDQSGRWWVSFHGPGCSSWDKSSCFVEWIKLSFTEAVEKCCVGGDEGGIKCCIQDALLFHRENGVM